MRIEASRRRWIVARAGLRALVGSYLDEDPAAVAFAPGPHGKPRLEPPSELRFSLAHSGELALLAVASERELGVDLEWVGQPRDALGLATRYFTNAERAAIAEAPEAERLAVFYRHWVAKEAFVKATGRGLSASLRSFELEAMRWSLQLLDVPGGYAAALVAEAPARARPIAAYDPLAE